MYVRIALHERECELDLLTAVWEDLKFNEMCNTRINSILLEYDFSHT